MKIENIISKKRDKKELSKEEIGYFVKEYVKDNIADYQAAALIMAMYINGMTEQETTYLTLEMAHSGDILDLSKISNNVVDKHSTGGVGDKITLILMPIIASFRIPVAKMSGRGLGFTGGTRDKLESIPGYTTEIETDEFIKNVNEIGIGLIGQTMNLAPADKKIYALRDSISCVDSIPLIASSIMSKKIAAGANKIVLDVTVGKGAFMKEYSEAVKLSKMMKKIGKLADKETVCVLTNMNEPIGYTIGNSLEVIEAINCLKGNMPEDIKEIVTTLGAYIIKLAGKGENLEENKEKILECIKNGIGYMKFVQLVNKQKGDTSYLEDTSKFKKAKHIVPVFANETGYIKEIDAEIVGSISIYLGAGRNRKEDDIDNTVGIVLEKKVGDYVEVGKVIAYIHCNDESKVKGAVENLNRAYKFSKKIVKKENTIIDII